MCDFHNFTELETETNGQKKHWNIYNQNKIKQIFDTTLDQIYYNINF